MSSNQNRSPDGLGARVPDQDGPQVTGTTTGKFTRPIDAPSLPPWLAKARSNDDDDDDDAPTVNVIPGGPSGTGESAPRPPEPPVDPRDLARRLADEAKRRIAASRPPEPEPGPTEHFVRPTPSAPHHQQHSQQEPSMSAEDPRELARRLADEAKRRLRDVPPPVDEPLDELFDDPPDEKWTPPSDDDDGESLSSEMVTRPLAERASAGGVRPMSALEALAAAREAEKQRTSASRSPPADRPLPARPAPEPVRISREDLARAHRDPAPVVGAGNQRTAEPPRPSVSGPAPLGQVEAIVREHFPGSDVAPAVAVTNPDVFRALWRAHRARAQHEGDVHVITTAGVLLDAIDRVPAGWLVAARVAIVNRHQGAEAWAVWIDLERRTLLGATRPADVYLAGI